MVRASSIGMMKSGSDLPAWLTAIGTLTAAAVALFLAGRDGRRANRAARRRQAELVTAWLLLGGPDAPGDGFVAQNASDQPVYEFIAALVSIQGAYRETAVGDTERNAPDTMLALYGQLPPGRVENEIPRLEGGMFLRFGIEVAFRDAAGRHWLRRGDGHLKEVRKDPVALFGLSRPIPWTAPRTT
jgi:hypothetical protein